MKNKSKERKLWKQVKYRLNSSYRGLFARKLVDSKEQVGSLLIGIWVKLCDWMMLLTQSKTAS